MIEYLLGAATVIVIAGLIRWLQLHRRAEPGSPSTQLVASRPRTPADLSEKAAEILMRMNEGVLVADENLKLTFANRSARRLLGIRSGGIPKRIPAVEVAEIAQKVLDQGAPIEEVAEIYFPSRTALRINAVPLSDRTEVLVVLQDVSEQLRTQQARREFVAHASHELKSPVAGLQVLAEAMADALQHDDDANARRFSSRVLTELSRLSKLVEDLLDLSKLEGPIAPPTDPCDLVGIAGKEAASLRSAAAAAGLSLEADLVDGLWITGDAGQLSLLVRNLLQNAIQYTPTGGSIRIAVRAEDGSACISVSDDGIGIPLEAQSRIFERFYRVDRARSRDRGGTGLGLAIVKHVVESHQGQITVASELGSGSTFTARFPLRSETTDPDTQEERETA